MQLKKAIERIEGLAYLLNDLDIQSSWAKRQLLETEFITDPTKIEQSSADIEQMQSAFSSQKKTDSLSHIKIKLGQINDISSTINQLFSRTILNDIDLFEIKRFCLLNEEIRTLLLQSEIEIILLPNLSTAIQILDPDNQKIPHFYVYDSYSEKLFEIRKMLKNEKKAFNAISETDIEKIKLAESHINKLYEESVEIEDQIRSDITLQLSECKEQLQLALEKTAYLDILIAKAAQAQKLHLTKPVISETELCYKALFNPYVKNILEEKGKQFQSIDITLHKLPHLVTGANMAGKTVLLKTIELSQYLFQFGFFVPAVQAQICIVDSVMSFLNDEQTTLKGLSSFAAEILTINEVVDAAHSGKNILVLIDELARTTNPFEGRAIVNALLEFLYENKIQSIITTHYNGIEAPCKKFRVKGFTEKNGHNAITPQNINDFMDYSLIEEDEEHVPMEALHIAQILGVSSELLRKAEKYMNTTQIC